jgi:2,4-dienoyl-CoA reductase (NADPH2)
MHTRLEIGEGAADKVAAFYAERARGGVGLIITGGVSPNAAGRLDEEALFLARTDQLPFHRTVTDAVHSAGAPICLQVLHAGRYAKLPEPVGASDIPSRINRSPPRALTANEIEATIEDFVRCAELAREAGYDAVEIMGSEGYLISQFLCRRTNRRTDNWGGSPQNMQRLPVEIVRRLRARLGREFPIIFRISVLDLVEDGMTGDETIMLGRSLSAAGVDAFDTGIGWHEARVPTIAYMVPRAAFSFAVRRLRDAVDKPVMATNRINTPDVAERLLADGVADAVALARPLLADADFAAKAREGRGDEINACIACNQACLDRIYSAKTATCLVNPRACREREWPVVRAARPLRVAVVGGGAAGMSCATVASEAGHSVTLYEALPHLGGQLNLAASIPGKEFGETIRYFSRRLARLGVQVNLSARPSASDLKASFDEIVIATGVVPRVPEIPGGKASSVLRYDQVLSGEVAVGRRVAIIGAGGIGFDTALYLTKLGSADFLGTWGVDTSGTSIGGLTTPTEDWAPREIWLLQRSQGPAGRSLGMTTGWTIRSELARRNVRIMTGVAYRRVEAKGLVIVKDSQEQRLEVDNIVICAGQVPVRSLYDELCSSNVRAHLIGGARVATELDAFRAIEEGSRLAMSL